MDEGTIVRCPNCGTKNRIPVQKSGMQGICGKCGSKLPVSRSYANRPVETSDSDFESEVIGFGGPVLVEFTAPW